MLVSIFLRMSLKKEPSVWRVRKSAPNARIKMHASNARVPATSSLTAFAERQFVHLVHTVTCKMVPASTALANVRHAKAPQTSVKVVLAARF